MTQDKSFLWKRILAGTAAYSLAMLLSRTASFFLLPLYTRYLTPADYGVLEIVDFTMYMLGAVVGISIAGDALFYFHARLADPVARRRAVQTVLLAAVGISIAGCGAIQLVAPQLSVWFFKTEAYTPAMRVAAGAFLFGPPGDALLCYLRATERTTAFMTVSLLRLAGSIVLNVTLLVVFRMGLYAMLVSNLVVSAVIFAFLAFYSMRQMQGWAGFDAQILRKVARYSAPIGISSMAMLTVHYGDRFFLTRYCSLAEIGVYALAYKLGMALNYLNWPFQMFWRSQVYGIVDDEDGDRVFVRVFMYLEILFVSVAFGLSLFATPVVQLLSSKEFWGASKYVPFLVAAYAFNALEYQMQSALLVAAKTRKIMISTLTGVAVCVTAYVVGIPRFGVWGAVVATCLAFSTMFSVTFYLTQGQRHLPFSYAKMVILPLSAIAFAVARPFIQPTAGLGGFAVSALVFAALPVTVFSLPVYREERQIGLKAVRKLAHRLAV